VNIAARLCDRAADGEILLSQRAYVDVESTVDAEPLGAFELKGVRNEIETYRVLGINNQAAPTISHQSLRPSPA
jgi:class 3 adenylate cyclase